MDREKFQRETKASTCITPSVCVLLTCLSRLTIPRGKAWGVVVDLAQRTVRPCGPPRAPLPPLLQRLAERMRKIPVLSAFHPNEANALDYRRGEHELYAHSDDRWDRCCFLCTPISQSLTLKRPSCTSSKIPVNGHHLHLVAYWPGRDDVQSQHEGPARTRSACSSASSVSAGPDQGLEVPLHARDTQGGHLGRPQSEHNL